MTFYGFRLIGLNGKSVPLHKFRNKLVLVVNTATCCYYTSQYAALQKMYEDFAPLGFEILDIPCDQFGQCAPGTNEEIHKFCVDAYGITFPQFAKAEVTGENAIPLYQWMTSKSVFAGFSHSVSLYMHWKYKQDHNRLIKSTPEVRWNFTKFLINRKGEVIDRFEPTAPMPAVRNKIYQLLTK